MHTVEKIGGTSMSRFGDVLHNVILGPDGQARYNRIFVVSAYSGITNALLENKKTGAPGVYAAFEAGGDWLTALETVRELMTACNRSLADLGLDQAVADAFAAERLEGLRTCLQDLERLRSFGYMQTHEYLPATRELLSAQGEAHSAFNSVEILRHHGVNAVLVDLTGWRQSDILPLDEAVRRGFEGLDFATCLPIVTGYVKCGEGIMKRFSRGYSEITFSKCAVLTGAAEGVIHKEYHLSSGDPARLGADRVRVIGNTNFDIADQMSELDMEAIHSKAAKEMELRNIPIRVKNAFEPDHPGTLIHRDYVSPEPRVEMICGREDLLAIEVFDSEMVEQPGYDYHLLRAFNEFGVNYIAKNTNANTITHYIPQRLPHLDAFLKALQAELPEARLRTVEVALVSVLGSNMKCPGFLSRAATALAQAEINVLALDQSMRQVNMQFIVERGQFDAAIKALHRHFIEGEPLEKPRLWFR